MGDYVNPSDVSTLLPGFYQGGSSASDTSGSAIATQAISRAESKVKAAAAVRYTLPFTVTPPEIIRMSQDLTCLLLIQSTTYQEGKENSAVKRFEGVLDDLKALKDGEMPLTFTDGSLVPTNVASKMSTSTPYTPIFGLDDPKDWNRDPQEVDDQSDARE
jgi:phage gp36-like protein